MISSLILTSKTQQCTVFSASEHYTRVLHHEHTAAGDVTGMFTPRHTDTNTHHTDIINKHSFNNTRRNIQP